ncbi:hypothetical protein HYV81_02425 [Candidatus Woesearchaeota archaeon]|nr:hypothetical protein [Candidatus Woesearchaeota archaeon]
MLLLKSLKERREEDKSGDVTMGSQADVVSEKYLGEIEALPRAKLVHFRDESGNPRGFIIKRGVYYAPVNPVQFNNGSMSELGLSTLDWFLIIGNENLGHDLMAAWARALSDGNGGYYHNDKKLLLNPSPLRAYLAEEMLAIFPNSDGRKLSFFKPPLRRFFFKVPLLDNGKLPSTYEGHLRKDISYLVL